MIEPDKLESVEFMPLFIDLGEGEKQYAIMIFERKGEKCVAFAIELEDGTVTFGPVPRQLVEFDACRQDTIDRFAADGLTLVFSPEQLVLLA